MSATKREIQQYLYGLASTYERLSAERSFLMNDVQTRLAAVNAERQEIVAEAQAQLDRLNVLRLADGEAALTLQQVRDIVNRVGQRGPRG